MRKIIILALCASALFSCTRETLVTRETLDVACKADESKVQLSAGKSVWNAGDMVSVFYGSSTNECWNYVGSDKAASGKISHDKSPYRFGGEIITALYPYSASATFDGSVITTELPSAQKYVKDSYGTAVMTAVTSSSTLNFSCASSFIALGLKGIGAVKSAVLRGGNGEALAGKVSVDVSGSYPVMTLLPEDSSAEITVSDAGSDVMLSVSLSTESYIYFCVPPMTFTNGFIITLTYVSGETRECRYTIPATVGRGEVLRFHDYVKDIDSVIGKKEIMLDFRGGNNPFTSDIITTASRHYRESDSLASESENLPDGKTAYTKDGNYPFTIYTKYGLGSSGTPQYGVTYRTAQDYVSLGRPGSFIKTPAIPGYCLYSATYEAGSTAGTPCFATDREGTLVASEKIGTTADGGVYTFCIYELVPDKSYYLMVNSGNLTFRYLKFIFIPE